MESKENKRKNQYKVTKEIKYYLKPFMDDVNSKKIKVGLNDYDDGIIKRYKNSKSVKGRDPNKHVGLGLNDDKKEKIVHERNPFIIWNQIKTAIQNNRGYISLDFNEVNGRGWELSIDGSNTISAPPNTNIGQRRKDFIKWFIETEQISKRFPKYEKILYLVKNEIKHKTKDDKITNGHEFYGKNYVPRNAKYCFNMDYDVKNENKYDISKNNEYYLNKFYDTNINVYNAYLYDMKEFLHKQKNKPIIQHKYIKNKHIQDE